MPSVGLFFLLLVAVPNSSYCGAIVSLWSETRTGHVDLSRVDHALSSRGCIAAHSEVQRALMP